MADESDIKCESSSVNETVERTKDRNSSSVSQPSHVDGESKVDRQTLLAVLQFLKKYNLKDTECVLKREACVTDEDIHIDDAVDVKSEVSSLLSFYKSDGNALLYEEQYVILKKFIETSLDILKCELSCLLYPIFVHVYLKLVFGGFREQAIKFFDQHCLDHEESYEDEMRQLMMVTKNEHMHGNQLFDDFRCTKFIVRMSRDSYVYLKRFLNDKNMTAMLTIIQEHLTIDVFEGVPRTKLQIERTSGAMLGSASKEANKSKVMFGLLKEPELNVLLDDDEEDMSMHDETKSSKKRKGKKDSQLLKKSKADPNAPAVNRIPLPELKDSDKVERAKALRELSKKVILGPDVQPSVLFYTFVNSCNSLTSVDICEDSSLLSAGFSDSVIRIWSLNSTKLCKIKSPDELNVIDKESDDVMEHIMNEQSASESRSLYGHSGPVYSTAFSPDKTHMVSSSEDGTVRLWSLYTWTNLVSYKGHIYPVWSVKFGPLGHYFVSGGFDRTARLWSTDHHQPLRIFAGHLADVECVDIHPNSNYVVTGSSDRTVRLWDVLSGSCVRVMTGHKAPVSTVAFAPDGRFLATAGYDCQVLLWDLATGELVSQLKGHTNAVCSLSFSREGSVLASGGQDNVIRLWDMSKVLISEHNEEVISETMKDDKNLLIGTYTTKATAVHCVHFNRRNILLGAGPFVPV